ncbi:DUF4926 domain-containing protein [Alienimonas chondri]|uniref:DUF4926 domain-containing protein n=1 Tax=Alienimonas chondri TaxID=2681879 RepID=A0ABX1V9M6_9PLAN|nr:DUF4926 domain-containing protein [Alienimonas chondri]NNJ24454.1 hypothetical protein [Alienimonas chondri]
MPAEHSRVALTKDCPEEGLSAGDVGTVVHIYGERGVEVEFFNGAGGTVAVLSLPADTVRPLGERDVLHARRLAA